MKKVNLELFIHFCHGRTSHASKGTVAVLLLALLSLASCRALKVTPTEIVRDSIVIRTEYVERIDTAYVTVERWSERAVVRDTVSVLENTYCITRAEVDADGWLIHSLATKPGKIPVPVTTVETSKDSIVYKTKYVKEPYPVEKELTWGQQARLRGFWYLLAAAVLMAGWIFRKPLKKLLLRIIIK